MREVPVPEAVPQALDSWTKVDPLARGVALRDEDPLLVALAVTPVSSRSSCPRSRSTDSSAVMPAPAGVPDRLAQPHALRAYWTTHCLEAGGPVHEGSARLGDDGHVERRTTARYAAARPEQVDSIADVLDRRHQAARRAGGG